MPTAGFRWTFTGADTGTSVVEQVADAHLAAAAVGGRAWQRFKFRAVGPGTARLLFAYGRSWEPEPRRTEQVQVQVE